MHYYRCQVLGTCSSKLTAVLQLSWRLATHAGCPFTELHNHDNHGWHALPGTVWRITQGTKGRQLALKAYKT
jgi:hypothetical protein